MDLEKALHMASPQKEDWIRIAQGFEMKWNFPNCIGALDGKHVVIQAPPNSGSMFFNYKKSFSIVLMALVDHLYRFICIDVGAYGSNSDGGIFANCALGKALNGNLLDLPLAKFLPKAPELGPIPHVIVGDEAFPLKTNLLRPYPGHDLNDEKRIFNYRLSRARRIVENVFGILAARWKNVDKVIITYRTPLVMQKAAPIAENTEMRHEASASGTFESLRPTGNRASQEAVDIRDKFKTYFNSNSG